MFQLWHGKTQNKVQKQSSCYKILFVTADQEEVTLTIFDDKFSVLYAIYKQQSGHVKWRLGFVRVPVNFFFQNFQTYTKMRFLALFKHYIINLEFLNSSFCSNKGPNES